VRFDLTGPLRPLHGCVGAGTFGSLEFACRRHAAVIVEMTAMDKDSFIRAYHENTGSWVGLATVYAFLIAGMVIFGSFIV